MIQPMSVMKRRLYFYFLCLVFILVIPFLILYAQGFRFTKDWGIARSGAIYVYVTESDSDIYLDGEKVRQSGTLRKGALLSNLKAGHYNLLVSKEGFSPWKKEIDVVDGFVAEAYPFMLNTKEDLVSIPEFTLTATSTTVTTQSKVANPEYKTATALFIKEVKNPTTLSATTTPLMISSGNLALSQKENSIEASWDGSLSSLPLYFCKKEGCNGTSTVFVSKTALKHFDFLPGREDVIVILDEQGIFVTEFDTRTPRNTVFLIGGVNLDFRVSEQSIYIKDGAKISRIDF